MASCFKERGFVALILIFYVIHAMYLEYKRHLSSLNSSFVERFETTDSIETSTDSADGLEASDKLSFIAPDDQRNRSSIARDSRPSTVISWEGVKGMNDIISQYWKGGGLCEKINDVRSAALDPDLPITLNLSFGCNDLFKKSGYGTGNFIAMLYGIRLIARVYGNIGAHYTCHDAEETKNDLIIPWLTGWFPPRPSGQNSSIPISIQEACGNHSTQPLSYMYKEMQYDLRKMAIALMGVPSPDHPSARFAERLSRDGNLWPDSPPFPATVYELDDAVLHFRCGDLMHSVHSAYSFMKFSGYTRHISPEAESIGILTQPFDIGSGARRSDSGQLVRNRCRIVVSSLVDYIKEQYPSARVRVHNSVNESIALSFARMVMANQAIAGISSFSVIPAVSTFGTGYVPFPDYIRGPNMWLINPRIDELADNVVLFYEPDRISVGDMKDLWKNGRKGVLAWFRNETA
jgi:hypothetical protein